MAIELNRDNYEDVIFQPKGIILVDFWGPQCGPCLALNPAVERLEEAYAGKIRVGKVNATGNRMLCAKLRVLGLPTFIVYKDGQEMNRLTGNDITEKVLINAVEVVLQQK
jgi:thioredoxin 1